MPLQIGQDIEVHIRPGLSLAQVISRGKGIRLEVVEDETPVFVPIAEYPTTPADQTKLLRTLQNSDSVLTRVIDRDIADGTWIVSYSQALQDNVWTNEAARWHNAERTVKQMCVTHVHGNQVYGEIIPGMTGSVSLRDIASYLGNQNEEDITVLVGDYLIGYVDSFDRYSQLVSLDVMAYLRDLDIHQTPEVETPLPVNHLVTPLKNHIQKVIQPFQTILIVDDDIHYVTALERRLKGDGLTVFTAHTAQEARDIALPAIVEQTGTQPKNMLQDIQIDIAIIDINLAPSGMKTEGLELAKQLREHRPDIKILLMSGDIRTGRKLRKGADIGLQIQGFIAKPFGIRKLRTELAKVAQSSPALPTSFLPAQRTAPDLTVRHANNESRSTTIIEDRVRDFGERVGAEKTTLFSIHPISLFTDIVAGNRPSRRWEGGGWEFWQHKLRQSPVRDVAVDQGQLLEKNATDALRLPRNLWLHRAYGYLSCIGVPVKAVGERAYCLFAFHTSSNAFDEQDVVLADMYAVELAAILDKERLLRVLEAETRYVTSGITLSVLGHELRTTLNTAELVADEVREMAKAPTREDHQFLARVDELHESVNRATEICAMFTELASRGRESPVRIQDCIERAMWFAQRRVEELETCLVQGDMQDNLFV